MSKIKLMAIRKAPEPYCPKCGELKQKLRRDLRRRIEWFVCGPCERERLKLHKRKMYQELGSEFMREIRRKERERERERRREASRYEPTDRAIALMEKAWREETRTIAAQEKQWGEPRRYLKPSRLQYLRNKNSKTNGFIALRIRTRIYKVLKGHAKSKPTLEMLGCDLKEFRRYIESKFEWWMDWDNYGKEWHIDHIIPCAAFDLSQESEQRQCFHYTNLQPMGAHENKVKSSRVNGIKLRNLTKSAQVVDNQSDGNPPGWEPKAGDAQSRSSLVR